MRAYTDELVPPQVVITPMSAGADFGVRFLARGIDTIYWVFLYFVAAFAAAFCLAILHAAGAAPEDWMAKMEGDSVSGFLLRMLSIFLYHVFAEGIGGISLGKLICGLRVVQISGRPCTMAGAFKRGIAYHWDALFFGLVGYQSMKESVLRQRYGDKWGETVVVRKSVFTSEPKHPTWRLLLAILIGSGVSIAVQFTELLLKVL